MGLESRRISVRVEGTVPGIPKFGTSERTDPTRPRGGPENCHPIVGQTPADDLNRYPRTSRATASRRGAEGRLTDSEGNRDNVRTRGRCVLSFLYRCSAGSTYAAGAAPPYVVVTSRDLPDTVVPGERARAPPYICRSRRRKAPTGLTVRCWSDDA